MADFALAASLPFGLLAPGRHGRPDGPAGVAARFRQDRRLLIIEAAAGKRMAVAERLAALFGVPMPQPGEAAILGEAAGLASQGPKSWLLIAAPGSAGLARLPGELAGLAALIDQSDGRIILEISGAKARETLAKGTNIDLHPRAFRPGSTAMSLVAHVIGQVIQVAETRYLLIVPRSTAAEVGHWLDVSAAEFGLDRLADA